MKSLVIIENIRTIKKNIIMINFFKKAVAKTATAETLFNQLFRITGFIGNESPLNC